MTSSNNTKKAASASASASASSSAKNKSPSSSSSSTTAITTTTKDDDGKPTLFYKLSAAELPDELFLKEVNVKKWIGDYDNDENNNNSNNNKKPSPSSSSSSSSLSWMKTTSNPNGFMPGELNQIVHLQDKMVDYERCIGISLYMISNVTPILIPLLTVTWLFLSSSRTTTITQLSSTVKYILIFIIVYQFILFIIERFIFVPYFLKKHHQFGNKTGTDNNNNDISTDINPNDHKYSQYLFTERNTTKYCSTSYVWPASLHRPALDNQSVIYCLIPHGLAPYGVVGYPYWSKVWNDKLCSWTCSPILFQLPLIGYFMKSIGYIPAKSKSILWALQEKDRNVGIILDGISGMFHTSNGKNNEVGAILQRKGIIKIALKAGVPIVPCYGFGHTQMYDIYVDPFGILQYVSKKLDVSITPFFGRWGWFMGPPKRTVPVTVCLGNPIYPPPPPTTSTDDNNSNNSITQEQIDEYHTKLLDGFTEVFETHKSGYYGSKDGDKKKLLFVK